MDIRSTGPTFDRGIDRIIQPAEQLEVNLPRDGRLAPAEEAARPRLDQVLHLSSLNDVVQAELRPTIDNKDVLIPARYRQLLDQTLGTLNRAAEESSNSAPLKAAARLLREERELFDLLDLYRNTLFQG